MTLRARGEPSGPASTARSSSAPIRLLIADDHAAFRRSLGQVLQQAGGFELAADAEDGAQALALVARQGFDLALLDDDMPEMGGILAAKELRVLAPELRVLVLSLRASASLRQAARRAGAVDCISKKLAPEALIQAVREAAQAPLGGTGAQQAGSVDAVQPAMPPPLDRVRILRIDRSPDPERARRRLLAALREEGPLAELTPIELGHLADAPVRDLTGYRLALVARCLPLVHRFDRELVRLTLLDDAGAEATGGRWAARSRHYPDPREALADVEGPAAVLLGPPGSGKSTLLAWLALQLAVEGLRDDGAAAIPVLAHLAESNPRHEQGRQASHPQAWLEASWKRRFGSMPSFASLLEQRGVCLLLDGLNEISAASAGERRRTVDRWASYIDRFARSNPEARIVFASRSLDYSQPLSSPERPVPQIRIEALSDAQIEAHLDRVAAPGEARSAAAPARADLLPALRSPFYLRLFTDSLRRHSEGPPGRAGLITSFVRRAILREIQRGQPLLSSDLLLTRTDQARLLRGAWQDPADLPAEGVLVPGLARLARAMQTAGSEHGRGQVRLPLGEALEALDEPRARPIVEAGLTLDVLSYDRSNGQLMFAHQMIQECFAARSVATAPDPSLAAVAWRVDQVEPRLEALVAGLAPSEPLPPPATSGWEETFEMAAELSEAPEGLLQDLMPHNLLLAARAAVQPSVAARLRPAFVETLGWALVERSRDPGADLRHRIACGLALGRLGDPRLRRQPGPDGDWLAPPMVAIPGGEYPIGEDAEVHEHGRWAVNHVPAHRLAIAPFWIGRFPVTNAEFACFMAAGGYEDPRWWDTAAGRDWRRGIGTAVGGRYNLRHWRDRFMDKPERIEVYLKEGAWTEEQAATWRARVAMSEPEFEAQLEAVYPETVHREPRHWRDPDFDNPAQPVVAICWYEARAYCRWLAAQSGLPFRLPTEVEWEAAARGLEGRVFPAGEPVGLEQANLVELRVKRTTPVGVFVAGDTPEGVADMLGNVWEYTTSAVGPGYELQYAYPYRPDDGRELAELGPEITRCVRGASWNVSRMTHAAIRTTPHPSNWNPTMGFRLALGPLTDGMEPPGPAVPREPEGPR